MKIELIDLKQRYKEESSQILTSIKKVLSKGHLVLTEELNNFEKNICKYTGSKYCLGLNSGTDALMMSLWALGIGKGDEVITSPTSFVATIGAIIHVGAKPVFVDITEDLNMDVSKIESKITKKTKAIMPVSLYGQPADIDAIQSLADKYNLKVIIDGAQSFGSTYNGKTDSNLGDISTTSFFPSKPLGCYGDGGAVFTNNKEYANKIKMLRVHGQSKRYYHQYIGIGGRLDTLQAAVLLAKLPNFKKELKERQKVADQYTNELSKTFKTPIIKKNRTSAWAQYTLRVKNRDNLQLKLKEAGIPTSVFYPIPLHLQECFKYLNYKQSNFLISDKASKEVLSLPMNPFLTSEEINFITTTIKKV